MGNSEVGHLNIGAGRIVHMDITRIELMIQNGEFFSAIRLLAAMKNARRGAVVCTVRLALRWRRALPADSSLRSAPHGQTERR